MPVLRYTLCLFTRVKVVSHGCLLCFLANHALAVDVEVNTALSEGAISPYLVGAHTVYYNDLDAAYVDDPNDPNDSFADWCRETGVSTMRFPGGSVVKYWDWENPIGTATDDRWDPNWDPVSNPVADASNWMSLDEYLDFCDVSGIKPLVGVNYRSGYVFKDDPLYAAVDLVQESVDRAVRCVQHVVSRGYPGAFYYIGNEDMFDVGGPTSSANLFVQHAQAMKAVDPTIKIFWNDNEADPQRMLDYLAIAGAWADGYEFHGKWPFGGDPNPSPPLGTYANWLTEVPLRDYKSGDDPPLPETDPNNWGKTWRQKIAELREAAIQAGYPDLMLANNEYGWGKNNNFSGFNKFTMGLLQIDFLQEHFISGYAMTCFWANIRGAGDGLLDKSDGYRRNPQTLGWELLALAQGGTMVSSTSSNPYVYGFSAKTDTEILVYLLNKTETTQPLEVSFLGGIPDSSQTPTGIAVVDTVDHFGEHQAVAVTYNSGLNKYTGTLPALSYTLIRFPYTADDPLFVADFDAATPTESAEFTDMATGTLWGGWSGSLLTGKGAIRDSSGDRAVLVDKDGGGGFQLDANLNSSADLVELVVSFKVALRRTGGSGDRVSIQGLDTFGNVSFDLQIDNYSLQTTKTIAYIDPSTGFTLIPEGAAGDIVFMGDVFDPTKLRKITVYLNASYYRVGYEDGTWISQALPYNGSASTVTKVRFSGNVNAGVWLDDVRVIRNPTTDVDADGMADHFEALYFGSINSAVSTADVDNDGADNLAEYIAGTDPVDSESIFRAVGDSLPAGYTLGWTAKPGRVYSIYSTSDLQQPFSLMEADLAYPQNVFTPPSDPAPSRFFQIQVDLE